MVRYREALTATLAQSAAAYGYSVSIWAGGAALIHSHGAPGYWSIGLYVVGAIAAFAAVEAWATHGFRESGYAAPGVMVAGALHFVSAGAAVVAAAVVGVVVDGNAAWPIASFSLTAVYVLLTGAQVRLGQRLVGGAADQDGRREQVRRR